VEIIIPVDESNQGGAVPLPDFGVPPAGNAPANAPEQKKDDLTDLFRK
jgi:hypothetical protein